MGVYYILANFKAAPPPSIGFPGYIYPNEEICSLHNGTSCTNDPTLCCYNEAMWCPSDDNCITDNGAFPIGDVHIFRNQMFDTKALSPFPNAMLWNWATIFILGFGNLAALDFQVRCMAAKTPSAAKYGCLVASFLTLFIGIPHSFLGSVVRYVTFFFFKKSMWYFHQKKESSYHFYKLYC